MTRSNDQRIADILDDCDELELIITLKGQEAIPEQVLLRSAERLLEIIGEAASHVSDDERATYPNIDWRSLARLRILLTHHYHRSDPDLIWTYAINEAPALTRAMRQQEMIRMRTRSVAGWNPSGRTVPCMTTTGG